MEGGFGTVGSGVVDFVDFVLKEREEGFVVGICLGKIEHI